MIIAWGANTPVHSGNITEFPSLFLPATGEVNATILAKTPHLVFSEKYPSIGIVPKTPKIEIST